MRIGQNPAKFVESVPEPAPVTAAVITYIPFLSGYYAEMLEVLKTCLRSLRAHTEIPYDLLIFDNASCPEVRAYLSEEQEAGHIQYLVLSEKNLGKAAAWNFIFNAAPGKFIAYADADIYFKPGWLKTLVSILETYPNAGMVTGIPMWSPEQFSTATVDWAAQTEGIELEQGKLLPWEDYWQHARSLGQDEPTARGNYDQQEDRRISDRRSSNEPAAQFYVGAGHFQFAARKEILQQVLPIPADRPMGQVRRLDVAINEKGYLRLSTPEWWVRHMGNTPGEFADKTQRAQQSGKQARFMRGPLRKLVQWVYHKSFDWLYKK